MKTAIALSLIATTASLSACASQDQQEAYALKQFSKFQTQHNSCKRAMLITHDVNSENEITTERRYAAFSKINFDIVMPEDKSGCSNPQISRYMVGFKGPDGTAKKLGPFYVRDMPLAAAQNDSDIYCRKTYQPPIRPDKKDNKRQVATGYQCTPKSQMKNPYQGSKQSARFYL
jgi:hypothetical protein